MEKELEELKKRVEELEKHRCPSPYYPTGPTYPYSYPGVIYATCGTGGSIGCGGR